MARVLVDNINAMCQSHSLRKASSQVQPWNQKLGWCPAVCTESVSAFPSPVTLMRDPAWALPSGTVWAALKDINTELWL